MSNPGPNTGSLKFGTGQVIVGPTPTPIVPANPTRRRITLTNTGDTNLYVGNQTVAAGTGQLLSGIMSGSMQPPLVLQTVGPIYGIGEGGGSEIVTWFEEYD